jgi:hypothetical protein
VYVDLPVTGPATAARSMAQQQSIVKGAFLALDEWDHRVTYGPHGRGGTYYVHLRGLTDADPTTGSWSQDATAARAQMAAADPTTVAYIGDFDSAATAISLQTLNPSLILQVSPWSPYVGFTDVNPADGKGDPARFSPSGQNTFARLVPSDLVLAQATVEYMRRLGVKRLYVLGDVSVFDAAVAQLVANEAPRDGVTVVSYTPGIDTNTNSQPRGYVQTATTVAAERPDAVFLGATPGVGATALWRELHAMMPAAKLFAPSTLATPSFLRAVAAVSTSSTTTTTTASTSTTGSTTTTPTTGSATTIPTIGSTTTTTTAGLTTGSATGATAGSTTGSTTGSTPRSTTGPTTGSTSQTGSSPAQGLCVTAASLSLPCASAAGATYVTSPILEPSQYPPAARGMLRAYRRHYRVAPTAYSLYGYEAMVDVLRAIQKAGAGATNRAKLLDTFFHRLGVIRGVIGDYTINGFGDSSLDTFDGYRVSAGGELVLDQRIVVG